MSHSRPAYCAHSLSFFFFNAPRPSALYTLSLHDALPISTVGRSRLEQIWGDQYRGSGRNMVRDFVRLSDLDPVDLDWLDRKSTRLNSSHQIISYAVFCLKKKKQRETRTIAARFVLDYWRN